jgi:hypothetical protein
MPGHFAKSRQHIENKRQENWFLLCQSRWHTEKKPVIRNYKNPYSA